MERTTIIFKEVGAGCMDGDEGMVPEWLEVALDRNVPER